jgi:tetratricopeptide (TPR) repeat protein
VQRSSTRSSTRSSPHRARLPILFSCSLAIALLVGCSDATSPDNGRPPSAEKWFRRAQSSFASADFDEARDSVQRALAIVPEDIQVRTLAAQLALASLDYGETLRLLKSVRTSEAAGIRGRALWYKGELDAAADELDAMLNDPDVKDDWAKATSKLARRGAGRTPFTLSGGMLASVEMVHVSPVAPYFVVPLEIDGDSALAMLATGSAEVVLDSATRPDPSWVQLSFGHRRDVQNVPGLVVDDVPALAQDLSGLSKEIGAPIKALIGVNLLRHIHATMDYEGRQFVVRAYTPPPPPSATRVSLHYVRGGGMVVQSAFGGEKGPRAALLVDTSRPFPIALDQEGWKKAGITADSLKLVAGDPEQKLHEGVVPLMRLGAFDVPRVLGLYGVPISDFEKLLSINIDGVVGAGLLYGFRCTFGDAGRLLWIEDDTVMQRMLEGPGGPRPPVNEREAPPTAPPAAAPPAPKPTAAPPAAKPLPSAVPSSAPKKAP